MAVTPELIARCLDGDRDALLLLVEQLTPVIQARVARQLRRSVPEGRDARQDVADLTQLVFVRLLENEGRKLRAWNPERGLSCEQFVGYLAEREVVSRLRRKRSSPWTDRPTETDWLDARRNDQASPEAVSTARNYLEVLLERIRDEWSEPAQHMFELIYVQELSPEEVATRMSMNRDAVYAWRSRLAKKVRALRTSIESSGETGDVS